MHPGIIHSQDMILLFDEFGTPSFGPRVESKFFIGVSVLYMKAVEGQIFDACDKLAGLSCKSPKKNNEILSTRALDLADVLSKQKLAICIRYIDLTNSELSSGVKAYHKIGNKARLEIRSKLENGVRERKIPQILYNQILSLCLFDVIADLVEVVNPLFSVHPFIDNWSIPQCDREIILDSQSLQKEVNNLLTFHNKPGHITVSGISILDDPSSKRKRFIDAVTSIVSRSPEFRQSGADPCETIKVLASGLGANMSCKDVTTEVTKMLKEFSIEFDHEFQRGNVPPSL